MLLEIIDGSITIGGKAVLSHFSFEIRGTEKAAIVGRNGAGKTSLLNVLTGSLELDSNEKNPAAGLKTARAFSVGMLAQNAAAAPDKSVETLIEETILESSSGISLYDEERYAFEQRFDRLFTGLGFRKEDKTRAIGTFSGGEQIKIELIRLLLTEPEVLILDEPTNHLDLAAVEWLEGYLRSYPYAVVLVSHDRYFIDRVADVIWDVSGGSLTRYPGNYTEYRAAKEANYKKQLAAWRRQQDEIERQNALIETFKHKPKKAAFARSRRTMLARMEKIEKPVADDAVIHTGDILPNRPGSKWTADCDHLQIGYDTALKELTLRIRRGQKIGVIGPNGSGKSTFLKTIAGVIPPLKGKLSIGTNVDQAYFDQLSATLTDEAIVFDWYHDRFPSLKNDEVRNHLAGYLFKGNDMGKLVKDLSGGEKARLVLASLMETRPNFLILDEPTNNMDIPAKETLESIFRDYKGTLLFVSHDRYFISRTADALLIFGEKDEPVLFYPFGYDHYQERKKKEAAGLDPIAARTLENQKLIDDLRAVPKAERHMLRQLSTEEATRDWQFEQNRTVRKKAEQRVLDIAARLDGFSSVPESEEDYFTDNTSALEERESLEAAFEKENQAWTETLLAWYDIWLETQPEEDIEA